MANDRASEVAGDGVSGFLVLEDVTNKRITDALGAQDAQTESEPGEEGVLSASKTGGSAG